VVVSPQLAGRFVGLEPLTLEHVLALCEIGLDAELWRWTLSVIRSPEDMRRYVEAALQDQAAGTALPFVILDRPSGRVIGSTRYGNIALRHRRLEIGWTWLGRAWQRTVANTETKLLLLTHAFESLRCQRVEFKTDALNARSRAALLRIGAREEGTFRRHSVTDDGRTRDSVYYSIVDGEWPEVKAWLERMMAR